MSHHVHVAGYRLPRQRHVGGQASEAGPPLASPPPPQLIISCRPTVACSMYSFAESPHTDGMNQAFPIRSIKTWLASISDASDSDEAPAAPPPRKKRCRRIHRDQQPRAVETGRALATMDGNVRRSSPRKMLEKGQAETQAGPVDEDIWSTPRQAKRSTRSGQLKPSSSEIRAQRVTQPPLFLEPTQDVRTAGLQHSSPMRLESSYASSTASSDAISNSRSSTMGARRREKSPVKSPSDLLFAQRPVQFDAPADMELPTDIKTLDTQLKSAKAGIHLIPQDIEDRVRTLAAQSNESINDWNVEKNGIRTRTQLEREFDELVEICEATVEAKRTGASEASWNDEVHSRLLREAFRQYPGVRHHNVTSARPCKELLAKHMATGATMESKLVDYTINLEPSRNSNLRKRVLQLLNSQPEQLQSVTQTLYSPVRLKPAAFSVETKSAHGREDDAKIQLGVWVDAHFARLRSLLQSQYGPAGNTVSIPTHPILIANVNVLAIMYALERDDGIWILPGPQLDMPNTVIDAYKCLAALRCLASWADGEFRKWVEGVLLPE